MILDSGLHSVYPLFQAVEVYGQFVNVKVRSRFDEELMRDYYLRAGHRWKEILDADDLNGVDTVRGDTDTYTVKSCPVSDHHVPIEHTVLCHSEVFPYMSAQVVRGKYLHDPFTRFLVESKLI